MRKLWLALLLLPQLAWADGETPGKFDYYVLALSWTPNFCVREVDPDHPQCAEERGLGWTLHGLWPQYETGWPSFCTTAMRAPSRAMTAAEADIYGTSGLAWHQWRKHGTCSGLSAEEYYQTAREAYLAVSRPGIFRRIDELMRIDPLVVEAAFLEANPNLSANEITITCKDNTIQEARICVSKDLEPRACGADVIRDCGLSSAEFYPLGSN